MKTNKIFSSKRATELWAADTFLWWIVFIIAVGFAAIGFFYFHISNWIPAGADKGEFRVLLPHAALYKSF